MNDDPTQRLARHDRMTGSPGVPATSFSYPSEAAPITPRPQSLCSGKPDLPWPVQTLGASSGRAATACSCRACSSEIGTPIRSPAEAVFLQGRVSVAAHGNVVAAVAFLHGLAAEDLRPEELDYHDADYELLITVRAIK